MEKDFLLEIAAIVAKERNTIKGCATEENILSVLSHEKPWITPNDWDGFLQNSLKFHADSLQMDDMVWNCGEYVPDAVLNCLFSYADLLLKSEKS